MWKGPLELSNKTYEMSTRGGGDVFTIQIFPPGCSTVNLDLAKQYNQYKENFGYHLTRYITNQEANNSFIFYI